MTDRHAARGPGSSDVEWRRSHLGTKRVHGFHTMGTFGGEALCGHSVPNVYLGAALTVAAIPVSDLCVDCLERHGAELTDRRHEQERRPE